jgi:hypothetical protein
MEAGKGINRDSKMVSNSMDQNNEHWIKAGSLMIDLPSMGKGFQETEKYRQDIWDYIQYRERLAKWPMTNEGMRSTYRNGMEKLDERKN